MLKQVNLPECQIKFESLHLNAGDVGAVEFQDEPGVAYVGGCDDQMMLRAGNSSAAVEECFDTYGFTVLTDGSGSQLSVNVTVPIDGPCDQLSEGVIMSVGNKTVIMPGMSEDAVLGDTARFGLGGNPIVSATYSPAPSPSASASGSLSASPSPGASASFYPSSISPSPYPTQDALPAPGGGASGLGGGAIAGIVVGGVVAFAAGVGGLLKRMLKKEVVTPVVSSGDGSLSMMDNPMHGAGAGGTATASSRGRDSEIGSKRSEVANPIFSGRSVASRAGHPKVREGDMGVELSARTREGARAGVTTASPHTGVFGEGRAKTVDASRVVLTPSRVRRGVAGAPPNTSPSIEGRRALAERLAKEERETGATVV